MFSALIGIPSPPDSVTEQQRIQSELKARILEKYSGGTLVNFRDEVDDEGSCPVVDDEGTATLLMNAVSQEPVTPEILVQEIAEISGKECELWASVPAPIPLCPSGGFDQFVAPSMDNPASNPHQHWETLAPDAMHQWGMILQKRILNQDQVHELKGYVDEAIANVEHMLATHRPSIHVGHDNFCFREIASRGGERFDLLLSGPARTFVEEHILTQSTIQTLLLKTLGSLDTGHVNFDISVVYSRPGAVHQGWHTDGDHQKGAVDAGWDEDGWKTTLANAYALCLFMPLIDLNDTVGFTQFWPASHRHRDLLGFGKVAELAQATWDGKCSAGDGVWYDYRLFHRGMPNQSESTVRPVLQILFKKEWYTEKANYGEESIIPNKQ